MPAPALVPLWRAALSTCTEILSRRGAFLAMLWAAGMAFDVLTSNPLFRWLSKGSGLEIPLPYGPTLLAWLYLAPLGVAQAARAIVRPASLLSTADTFHAARRTAEWRHQGFHGVTLWGLSLAPVLIIAAAAHGQSGLAWATLVASVLAGGGWLLSVAQIAPAETSPGRPLPPLPWALRWSCALATLGGLAITVIVSNLVVGLVVLPLFKVAADSGKALGALLIVLSNLGMVLTILTAAAVSTAAWQSHRQQQWQTLHPPKSEL